MMRIVVYVTAFLAIAGAVLSLAADAYSKAMTRKVTYSYIAEALDFDDKAQPRVTWNESLAPLDRPFTEADREALGQAIDEAFRILITAQSDGRSEILDDRFAGVALERAKLSVDQAQTYGGRISVLDIAARPAFFHRDGSLFVAELSIVSSRFNTSAEGPVPVLSRDKSYALMLRSSVGWRIGAYELEAIEPSATPVSGWAREELRGVNYYPANAPWREFWPTFDSAAFASDLERATSLGVNAIRIFLPSQDFSTNENAEPNLERLRSMLAIADAKSVRVVPTLFDMKGSYRPETWQGDYEYLRRLLPTLSSSPAVTFVDLKNEPDLDYDAQGRRLVEAWALTMIEVIRSEAPGIAITIGWSTAEAALTLAAELDVVTYHDYADLGETALRLAQIKASSLGKPVVVTEIGASSFEIIASLPGSPERQGEILAARIDALQESDGVFIWNLNDFDEVDPSAVGTSPWNRRVQRNFGLFGVDHTEKPAADAVRRAFGRR